jgi:light-regulated signal transduction histidine kinase (bacteriophytochrome)
MPASASKVTQMRPRIQRPKPAPAPSDEEWVPLTADSLHDLASPINQIGSLMDLILRKHADALDDDAKLLLGYLQTATARLQNLLSGLRTFMQVMGTSPACRSTDGNELLAAAQAMLQHAIIQSDALITHDALPELYCDPAQITYALVSLIDNSIKFRGERRPEIHVGAISEKKRWVVSVRDNGIGVDPRYAKRIFAAFKRVHNDTYPGSGVGLAITKRVIERHGGRVWVESELGQGATFFMELPKMIKRRTPSVAKRAVA